jgi:allophanate hydrolase subunit 2
VIRVERVLGVASVQDGGRRGLAWAGVPPGGALVPEALAAANRRVGNPDDAAAIEVIGGLSWTCNRPVATADGTAADRLAPDHRVRYLAVEGGIATTVVFGGRGASWAAGIGRPLRSGDELPLGAPGGAPREAPSLDLQGPIELLPGAEDLRDALRAVAWRVGPRSDRTGIRLEGPGIIRDWPERPSAPMVRGAVQLTPGGIPVVLGPDHPVTGGYPVIAVVRRSHLGRIGSRLPGDEIRFA